MLRTLDLGPEAAARALETIEHNARAQAHIVDDILDVSRIVTGKLRLERRPVELTPLVELAVDSARPSAGAKGIALSTALDPGVEIASGDPDRLRQVVLNLISNAVKFTPAGGAIEVRLVRGGDFVELTVSDTGVGIGREFLPHVFDRFRQADSSTTREYGGLGLGLSIARHLVELHGGTIRADSRGAGRGATFTVQLPLAYTA
jgi:signal transduction histidine kinase